MLMSIITTHFSIKLFITLIILFVSMTVHYIYKNNNCSTKDLKLSYQYCLKRDDFQIIDWCRYFVQSQVQYCQLGNRHNGKYLWTLLTIYYSKSYQILPKTRKMHTKNVQMLAILAIFSKRNLLKNIFDHFKHKAKSYTCNFQYLHPMIASMIFHL